MQIEQQKHTYQAQIQALSDDVAEGNILRIKYSQLQEQVAQLKIELTKQSKEYEDQISSLKAQNTKQLTAN